MNGTFSEEKSGTEWIFSGDHKGRVTVFIDRLKDLNDRAPGEMTKAAAEGLLVLAECVVATLRSFLIVQDVRERAGKTGNSDQ